MTTPTVDLLILGRHDPFALFGLADVAEGAGYGRVWIADERFFRDCWSMLGFLAGRLESIGLGVCVTDPFVRHPALTAVAAGTVDEMCHGRFTLGMGAGISGFAAMGIERTRPLTAMREAISLIRALLEGEPARSTGNVVSFDADGLDIPSRPGLPIMIATNGPKMLELAGELADEVMVQGMGSVTMVQRVRERLSAGAGRVGRDPSSIRLSARLDVALSDHDPGLAREAMRPGLVRHLATHHPRYSSFDLADVEVPESIVRKVADLAYGHSASAELERTIPSEWIDLFCLAGTRSQIGDRIEELVGAGVDSITVMPVDIGQPIPETVRLLGTIVNG